MGPAGEFRENGRQMTPHLFLHSPMFIFALDILGLGLVGRQLHASDATIVNQSHDSRSSVNIQNNSVFI